MSKGKSTPLLILGCQRSGTTLLAAMLGGHSEINMLFESKTEDIFSLIGKKYNGNKLLTWRQIRMDQRSNRFGHMMNRLANLDFSKDHVAHRFRPYPNSCLSIRDYIDRGAKIICLYRKKVEVVNSIRNRTKMSQAQAEKEYDLAVAEMDKVGAQALRIEFSDLVTNPEETLTGICSELGLKFEPRMLKGPEYNFVYPHKEVIAGKAG